LALQAHAKGLELLCDVRRGVPEYIVGDPLRIRQVIVNLVGNAIKFTDRGEVALSVDVLHKDSASLELHFKVRDTGIGIPAEKQKLIFEAFSQADGSMTRKYGGTGLGLTISARLVRAMRGEIWVESEGGRGSCFHFTVGVGVASGGAESPVLDPVLLQDTAVLVVDDNATNRRILTDLLSRCRMKPVPVASAPEALAQMRAAFERGQAFPLVLTDVHMPGMDGFALAAEIKRAPHLAAAAILMLTSGERAADLVRCRELGISLYLIKPVRRDELCAAVIRALTRVPSSRADSVAPVVAALAPIEAPFFRPARILLAEDNVVNQRLASRILEKRGYRVVIAATGREAVEALKREPFDLVLMDVQMPEMDGFEATAAIRDRENGSGAHIPIIAMTAHAMKGDQERCLQAGMDSYISKPIRGSDLLELVEKHCKSEAALQLSPS
jgi:two-component system, sensor histidine kinase and response regulator